MPKFEKLRFSLARAEAPPLVEASGHDDAHLDRAEFLRRAFSEPRSFLNAREARFKFHPIEAPENYVSGFFARERPVPLKHADLTPYLAENYEPALFVLSLDKAQVAWMEEKGQVGAPKSVLESFFEYLSKRTELKDWEVFVRHFERPEDYWTVIRQHRADITRITFRYVPPNAFGGRKLAQLYHKAVQEESRAPIVEETFKGPPGKINAESEMMQENAEMAEQGAGEREVRGRGNKLLYASRQGKVVETVPEEEMPTVQSPSFVRRVIQLLYK